MIPDSSASPLPPSPLPVNSPPDAAPPPPPPVTPPSVSPQSLPDIPPLPASDNTPISVPAKKFPTKPFLAVVGLFLLLTGITSGIILVRRQSQISSQAAVLSCSDYLFSVSRQGAVTITNNSTVSSLPQKVTVSINGQTAGIFDVPVVSAGQTLNVGTVAVPAGGYFTWAAVGTKDCSNTGTYAAPTPTQTPFPTPTTRVSTTPTSTPRVSATPTSTPRPSSTSTPTPTLIPVGGTNPTLVPTSSPTPTRAVTPTSVPQAQLKEAGAVENTLLVTSAGFILIGLSALFFAF